MNALTLASTSEPIWPVSVSGWVALVLSIASVLTIVIGGTIAWGKWLGHLDGLGQRLAKVEQYKEQAIGSETERLRQIDRIEHDHKDLIVRVGEAKQVGAECREDAVQHSIELGSRVAEIDKKISVLELSVSQRLTATETDIEHLKKET